jgi:hypothetical protein
MPGSIHPPTLLQRLRSRATGRVRLAMLLVFAVGLASQSLLGVLGGLHEITAHAHSAHGSVEHLAPHDHATAVHDGTDADEGGPLHVLLHYTHCCSHSAWMSGGGTMTTVVAIESISSPADDTRQISTTDLTAPFRPPIRA